MANTESSTGLFRAEAMQSNRPKLQGEVVLRSSWVAWFLCALVLVFVIGIFALIFKGEYTRRVGVQGYLIPTAGVLRIHSMQAGRAVKVHVREGEQVKAGQALVTVTDERNDALGKDARGKGAVQIKGRQNNLEQVITQQKELYSEIRTGLDRRLAALQQEMAQLLIEQETQKRRISLAETTHLRWKELAAQAYVTENAAQEKLEALTEQQARLQTLQRGHTSLQREKVSLESELAALPMRQASQIAELSRSKALAEQELIELDTRREVVVTSPQSGKVSGMSVKTGQMVAVERPLMTLLPQMDNSSTELEAHIFVQSKDAGFVQAGQTVLIRYAAFPYQKFGHYRATVTEVSRSPLLPSELPYPVSAKVEASSLGALAALAASPGSDPVFRIRARLENQFALAYGQQQSLQSGMQLEADILMDTRTIFEWILEPIYSMKGKYFQ